MPDKSRLKIKSELPPAWLVKRLVKVVVDLNMGSPDKESFTIVSMFSPPMKLSLATVL